MRSWGLKKALAAGRQSSHTAARPTSQGSTVPSRPSASSPNPAWLTGVLKMPVSCSVARPNSTVDRVRAQVRPWPLARAIHSHRAGTTRPETSVTVMMSGRRWLSWAAVRAWPFHRKWPPALPPPMRASTMIKVMVLTAAPAYMSLTAVSTGVGAGGRSGLPGCLLGG